jgi:hypothetical protein
MSVVGVGALVYGFLHAASGGWRNAVTITSFVAGVAVLFVFTVVQGRARDPLLPLRLFGNRNRVGSYMAMSIGAAMFSMFYFLTQFVQEILGYDLCGAGAASAAGTGSGRRIVLRTAGEHCRGGRH